jgi:putative endonuclease
MTVVDWNALWTGDTIRVTVVYHTYIMASESGVLYTGVTNFLERRVAEHKLGQVAGFSQQYKTHKLVYFEPFGDVRNAIAREKQLKRWRREKKVVLIERTNPTWRDLSEDFNK